MTTIKFRRDTSANWTSVNPIPAQGEPCYETDTGKLKIGNGSDSYTTLPYVSDGGGSSGDLPIATATTLGGVKIGNNLSITEDGTLSATGGSAGTTDYTQLENKPQINSIELTGNKTLNDLGIQPKGNYLTALPDNAVTTDTEQTITGKKSLPLSTTLGRLSFKADGFDDNSGRLIWTLDSGQSAALQISRYNYFGFLLNGSENWSIRNDDNQKIQTWHGNQRNIVIKTERGNGLKIVGKNDGRDLELTNINGDFSFLRSKDVDNSTIKIVDGKLTASGGGSAPTNMVTTDTDQTISGVKTFTSDIVAKSAANLKLNDAGNKKTVSLSTGSGGYLKVGCTGTSLSEFISMWDNSNNSLDIAPTYLRTRTSGGTKYEYINSQNIDTTYMKWDDTSKKLKVDTAAVAHLAMPSDTKVALTLGASGTAYTAPADGYVCVGFFGEVGGNFEILAQVSNSVNYVNGAARCQCPVLKGEFSCWYNKVRNDSNFAFYFNYAVGTVPNNTEPDF